MNDFRFAIRQLLKNPGFAAVAVTTLALGIGANIAIFSLIDSVLLRALPYPDSGRLVQIFEAMPGLNRNSVSGGAFKDWREHSTRFSHLAVYEGTEQNLTGAGTPERVAGWKVSSDFLSVLGIRPFLGRDFVAGEDRPSGDARITILTHAYWQARFGGDAGVVGRTLSLDQVPHTIVGILPPQALLNDQVQYLVPTVIDGPGSSWGRAGHFREVIARLTPGTTVEEAQSELRGIKAQLVSQYPAFKKDWSVLVVPLHEVYASRARPMLLVLLGTVVLVLLIVCANVSNLMLARGSARGREMAIRVALGAGHWRIFRQLLIESLLLAGVGCVAGLLVAQVSIGVLTRFVAGQLPQLLQPVLDWKLLAFSVVVSAGCGLAFGVFPAWRASRTDLNQDLKESERGSTSATQRRAQSWLVVSEFALTLVLLIGAGLFLRSFVRLLDQNPGFNPKQTLAFDLSFPAAKYPKTADRLHFVQELTGRLAALPGVEKVGAGNALPLSNRGFTEMASRADRPPRQDYLVSCNYVSGDFFAAMGIPLLRGRLIGSEDNQATARRAIVIDTVLANDLFPDEDAIGRALNVAGNRWEIVGIVAPVRNVSMQTKPFPTFYAGQAFSLPSTSITVRSALPPATLTETIRSTVLSVDPDQPIANIRTLEQSVDRSVAGPRTTLVLIGLFAVLAVGLACLGIYGVLAHAIGQRAREFSIRSALGAQRTDIVRLVLKGGLQPAGAGMLLGLLGAGALTRLLETQLFEVKARDPLVFAGAVAVLGLIAFAVILLPACRAARIDPIKALRHE